MWVNVYWIMEFVKRDICFIVEVVYKSNKFMLYFNVVLCVCCWGWDWKCILGRCFYINLRFWEKIIMVVVDVGYFRVIICLLLICILEIFLMNMDWCDFVVVSKIC